MDNIDDEIFKNNLINLIENNHKRLMENLEKESMECLDKLMDCINSMKKYNYKYVSYDSKINLLADIKKLINVINDSPDGDYDEEFKKWLLKECKIIIKLVKMKNKRINVKNFPLRIDKKTYEKIELYASQMKISVNTAINWVLDEFASQVQDEKENKLGDDDGKVINNT
jgi:predicted HicB family RNase H-like nuclease